MQRLFDITDADRGVVLGHHALIDGADDDERLRADDDHSAVDYSPVDDDRGHCKRGERRMGVPGN